MPINKDSLVAAAKERNWVVQTHTIKIPDATHPFGAKNKFNIEGDLRELYSDRDQIFLSTISMVNLYLKYLMQAKILK